MKVSLSISLFIVGPDDPYPWEDPKSRTPNSGLQYAYGVDYTRPLGERQIFHEGSSLFQTREGLTMTLGIINRTLPTWLHNHASTYSYSTGPSLQFLVCSYSLLGASANPLPSPRRTPAGSAALSKLLLRNLDEVTVMWVYGKQYGFVIMVT